MSAGLAALATFLQGGGKIIGDVANDRNKAIAAKNRDEVLQWSERAAMEWAEEQAKAKQIEDRMVRVGMTPPTDPKERATVMGQFGVRPEAMGTFEEFFAAGPGSKQTAQEKPAPAQVLDDANAKMAEAAGMDASQMSNAKQIVDAKRDVAGKAGEVAQAVNAAQDLEGGNVQLTERETSRSWKSPLADAIRPEAQRFMTETLQRKEQGTGELDAEERRLAKRMGLAQGYSSYLQKEDFDSMREQLKQVAESRRDRLRADSDLRGNQVQISTGVLGFDRTMEQTAATADARTQLEDKKIGARATEGAANRRTRIATAQISAGAKVEKLQGDELRYHQESMRKQIDDDKTLRAQAIKFKGKTFKSVEQAAEALGVDVEVVEGIFRDSGKLDMTKLDNRIILNEAALDRANKEQERRIFRRSDRSGGQGAGGKATSGGKVDWERYKPKP